MPQMSPMSWLMIILMLIISMMITMSNMSTLSNLKSFNKTFIKKSNKLKW